MEIKTYRECNLKQIWLRIKTRMLPRKKRKRRRRSIIRKMMNMKEKMISQEVLE